MISRGQLIQALRREDVAVEAVRGGTCVLATASGRSMLLRLRHGWWCHERPTTGDGWQLDKLHPAGMEEATARDVARLLASGVGVRLEESGQ